MLEPNQSIEVYNSNHELVYTNADNIKDKSKTLADTEYHVDFDTLIDDLLSTNNPTELLEFAEYSHCIKYYKHDIKEINKPATYYVYQIKSANKEIWVDTIEEANSKVIAILKDYYDNDPVLFVAYLNIWVDIRKN